MGLRTNRYGPAVISLWPSTRRAASAHCLPSVLTAEAISQAETAARANVHTENAIPTLPERISTGGRNGAPGGLFRKKQIGLSTSLESFLSEVEKRFVVLPITARICVSALSLPIAYPKDPADRIIGATALVEGIPLITADRGIRNSRALNTIW